MIQAHCNEPWGLCILRTCITIFFSLLLSAGSIFAQTNSNRIPDGAELPNAPAPAPAPPTDARHPSSLFGTVTDPNGQIVPEALVKLIDEHNNLKEAVHSGADGAFRFENLSAGRYRIVAHSPGMGEFTSPLIVLGEGDVRIVTYVVLPLNGTTTEIHVYARKDEIAEEEIHIAEQQRILGVLPNFYSAYDWNAPPLGAKQKYKLAVRSVLDPVAFLSYAAVAGIEQQQNAFSGYGGGAEGYGKRYGAVLATATVSRLAGSAVYPALFHQDPRYFYKGVGSIKSRAFYAISQSVMIRGDNGHQQPNYSHILGSLTGGAISNLYYPPGDRGTSLVFSNTLIDIGGSAAENLVREFLLKHLTTRGKGDTAQ